MGLIAQLDVCRILVICVYLVYMYYVFAPILWPNHYIKNISMQT